MYRFSRAIYRELSQDITEDAHSPDPCANHERVLRAVSYTHLTLPTTERV